MLDRRYLIVCGLLLAIGFGFRVYVARRLANDSPEDARVYAQMARNLLEQHVYSLAPSPPYTPSLIRLPGYSIFLAAIYSVAGHYNNSAVRLVQATLDTATCALVGLLAYLWQPDEKRKRASLIAALALAAACPFTAIYVGTILTETWAIFFTVLLCVLATFAFRASKLGSSLLFWIFTGLVAGAAVFMRPDCGLFAFAIGLTLVLTGWRKQAAGKTRKGRLARLLISGWLFSLGFVLILTPWTVRNWRLFHVFQPLAPTHGESPGEFVPLGYLSWVRTWIDDQHYIDPAIWELNTAPVNVDELPPEAFDSLEEKERVRKLFDQYEAPMYADDDNDDETSEPRPQPSPTKPPEMTPAIDAEFNQIARERIARSPMRFYIRLPLKRARSIWFDTHSEYYPFTGELMPLKDLDHTVHQQIWLPIFMALVWSYTILGVIGGWMLWRSKDFSARRWLLLVALMVFVRLAFFSSMENPEQRYTVEFFPLLAIVGGIAISSIRRSRSLLTEPTMSR